MESSLRKVWSDRAFLNKPYHFKFYFFLSGFSFTTIHESQDCRGRGHFFNSSLSLPPASQTCRHSLIQIPNTNIVFQNFHLVHSWILCLIYAYVMIYKAMKFRVLFQYPPFYRYSDSIFLRFFVQKLNSRLSFCIRCIYILSTIFYMLMFSLRTFI